MSANTNIIKKPDMGLVWREFAANMKEMDNLSSEEKEIVLCANKKSISELSDNELVQLIGNNIECIMLDVGCRKPGTPQIWRYTQTRFFEILKKKYSHLSFSGVRLAFEMTGTGYLDKYFQRDAQGKPDKQHFQQFSVDYVCRVLNAYSQARNDVLAKIYVVKDKQALIEDCGADADAFREKNIDVFNTYKKTKELELYVGGELFVWEWLQKAGCVDEPDVTDEHIRKARRDYMKRIKDGIINQLKGGYEASHPTESKEIMQDAYFVARRAAIKAAFDKMIEENIDVEKI